MIVKKKSLYVDLTIYIIFKLIIYQINIVDAYLTSLLDDKKFWIYMKLLSGIKNIRKNLFNSVWIK